jgi:hypothetical protein
MREALDDFTPPISLDPRHVESDEFHAEHYKLYDQFQNAVQDSEMVIKLDPNTSCNVVFAHHALGDDAEARQFMNTCYQKDPDPRCVGIINTDVRKVLFTRQARRCGGDGYTPDAREKTPRDRECEYQQNVHENLRSSGFEARAEACRNDISKCQMGRPGCPLAHGTLTIELGSFGSRS